MFALRVGRLAVDHILAGYGYEITALDLAAAVDHFLEAARQLGVEADAKSDLDRMCASHASAPQFLRAEILRLLTRRA